MEEIAFQQGKNLILSFLIEEEDEGVHGGGGGGDGGDGRS